MSANDGGAGYRKPPKPHQFGATKLGNRKGRPSGSKNIKTIVHEIAHEQKVVQENGRAVTYTIVELLFMTLLKKSVSGDLRAIKLLDRYREALSHASVYNPGGGFLVVPGTATMEEFERHMEAYRAMVAYEQEFPQADP
ncbi:MAG: DUF5681 domain-containing protein [Amaricoccus sp.]|uniref:DUF5681 domain-containing protein n=1 Tax=Amaricoccus sp. TaxID=1872485 RepID=UPI003315905D